MSCKIKTTYFIDPRDNKKYKTIKIGTQTWMAENLAYKVDEGCCYYNNDPTMREKYGLLYTYEAALNACPSGWHLPSDDEWDQLTNYLGSGAGNKLKATTGWERNNGTDESGFSALPGGYRNYYDGTFSDLGYNGYWWTSTPTGSSNAYDRLLFYGSGKVNRYYANQEFGFSVRCIKDK